MRVVLRGGSRDGVVMDVPHTMMFVDLPAQTVLGWNPDGTPGNPVVFPEESYQVSGEIETDESGNPLVVWRLRDS